MLPYSNYRPYLSPLINTEITRHQTGIMRVACADSLDRSHMVIFVLSLPIIAELAKSVALLPASSGLASL